MSRAGHQDDIGPSLTEPPADHAPDCTRPIDDHTHVGMVRVDGVQTALTDLVRRGPCETC